MTIWDRVYEDICKNCVIIEGIPLTDFRIFLLGSFVFIGVEIVIFSIGYAHLFLSSLLVYLVFVILIGLKSKKRKFQLKVNPTVSQILERDGIVSPEQVTTLIEFCNITIEKKRYKLSWVLKIISVGEAIFILGISGFVLPFIVNYSVTGLLDTNNYIQLENISITFLQMILVITFITVCLGKLFYSLYFGKLEAVRTSLYMEKIRHEED